MQFSAGTVLDNYKLLARVGAGSCGSVWQAENIVSGELYALKILSDNDLAGRELRALKLYREISHPALIRIRHIGQFDNTFFYTMDWCESSLAERKVSSKELLEIARKLTEGLSLLHSNGLLHRDIKPANIFFRQGSPVLGDIGLLTRQDGATFAGSPGFLAPSILSGKGSADRYSDCYALAKSLYCALSGLGPEQFPFYTGDMTSEASLLMRAVMMVCSENPSIHNAEELLTFLSSQTPKPKKKHIFYWIFIFLFAAAGSWFCYNAFRSQKPVASVPALKHDKPQKTESVQITEKPRENGKIILPMISKEKEKSSEIQQPQNDKTQSPKERIHQKTKQDRAETIKKWQTLPPAAEKKKQALNDPQKAYSIIGLSGRGRMTAWPQKTESLFLSKLSAEQQNEYRKCCAEIRKIESTEKWKRLSKKWWSAGYGSQIRKLESEKGLSSMDALRQLAENDPVLALLFKQGECHLIRDTMIRDANRKKNSDFPVIFETFVLKTAEYSSAFHHLNIADYQ